MNLRTNHNLVPPKPGDGTLDAELHEASHGLGGSLRVWWAGIDHLPSSDKVAALNERERSRANQFRADRDARRYLQSHALMRSILAATLQIDPVELLVEEGRNGKPRLSAGSPLHFNMSHSGPYGLFGVDDQVPIGVDIEHTEARLGDLAMLARECFTAGEYRELMSLESSLRPRAFLRCWTRKEACLKAIGVGLSVEPCTIETGLSVAPMRVAIPLSLGVCTVTVETLPLSGPLVAAVARLSEESVHLVQ